METKSPGEHEPSTRIEFADYVDESMLPDIMKLVSKDLSEPYSVFTYRYFLHNWPKLCICAYACEENPDGSTSKRTMVATVVSKLEIVDDVLQGYIAMLAVDQTYRKRGIGMKLVTMGIERMIADGCQEVMLETEASNVGALRLYSKLGFVKEELMAKYYLNSGDAFRLKFWIDKQPEQVPGKLDKITISGGNGGSVATEV